jgi:hypothetical protein
MHKRFLFFFFFVSHQVIVHSQINYSRFDSVVVVENSDTLSLAWAGGINSIQPSAIDLNFDGIKDLFVFDREGNTIKTFINKGIAGNAGYVFAPEYIEKFPHVTDIALLADYNCDGKEDLFSWVPGGLNVFKNISDTATGIAFVKVSELLYSDYGATQPVNLYVAPTDIPALADIDNDGDLDILSFAVGGTQVEFHKNLSLENYGICDSLVFKMVDGCWGKFYENASNSNLQLGFNCRIGTTDSIIISHGPHAGSTLLAIDLDGDTDKELILGDISTKNLVMLTNGGSSSSANMISQETYYPTGTNQVWLTFPSASFLDVDNDNIKDLIATTNTANASENYECSWYYKNLQNDSVPAFSFKKTTFLSDQMIDVGSGANPVFFDYNSDGLADLLVGNYGYYSSSGLFEGKIALYENTGTILNPSYKLITRDYETLSSLGLNALYPAFGDLDDDGDMDMILGEYNGHLYRFENTALPGANAQFTLVEAKYKNIDIGQFSTPQLVDVDRDGLLDLLVGERSGNINYFKNIGSKQIPDFETDPDNSFFGEIDVMIPCCTGYSVPYLTETDDNTGYELWVGSETGYIYHYTGIDGNLNGAFFLTDSIYTAGSRVTVSGFDINNDGKTELITGQFSGGVSMFRNNKPVNIEITSNRGNNLKLYPNPAEDFFDIEFFSKSNNPVKFVMVSVLGEAISDFNILPNQTNRINTKMISKGIYFLLPEEENIAASIKIIIY